jgi:hypothetical protein
VRISRREKVRNEEIKQQTGIKSSIMDDVAKQLVWYGYMQKMSRNELLKQIME